MKLILVTISVLNTKHTSRGCPFVDLVMEDQFLQTLAIDNNIFYVCNSCFSYIEWYLPHGGNVFLSSAVPHCILFSISHIESEPISLKNLKRRSEFFEKGKRLNKAGVHLIIVRSSL